MSYSSTILADSPLVYWRLGDAADVLADSSGNGHNGSYLGGTSNRTTGLVSGDTDSAHTFASGSRGQVTSAAWMAASSFTVMATITPTGVSGTQTVVARYGSSFSVSSFSVRLDNNKVGFYIFSGSSFTNITQSTTLTAGTTYDVAATYNGSTGAMTLYVNGSSVATGTQGSMNAASSDFSIGARYDGSEPFAGTIDDVSYFGSVLTGTQVSNFATQRASGSGYATSVVAASPLAYYRLNDPSAGFMADSSGNGHNAAYVGTPTRGVAGALTGDSDTAATFATGKYGSTTYASWQDVTSAVSLEAWVNVSTSGNYRHIVTKDTNGSGGSSSQWQFRVSNVNKIEFLLWHSSLTQVTSATTLSANTWYHVVATYSAATGVQAIYINGALDASTSGLSGNITTGTTPYMIGTSTGDGSPTYSGTMSFDELAVYTTALSSTRVAAHYTAGTTAPPSVTAVPATATASAAVPVVSASASVAPPAATASGSASAPVVSATAVVSPAAATATAGAPSPVVAAQLSVTAVAATATAAAIAPSLPNLGDRTITATAATATASAAAPSFTIDANVAGSAAAAIADALAPTVTATVSATVNAVAATATASAIVPTIFYGSPNATVNAVAATATAAGVVPVVTGSIEVGTDTSNALDGLTLVCRGTVTITRPVGAPPSGLAERYDVAIPYPVPVMVDGRPT